MDPQQQQRETRDLEFKLRLLSPIKKAFTLGLLLWLGAFSIVGHLVVRYGLNDFPLQKTNFDNTAVIPAGTDLNLNYNNTEFPHVSFTFFETVHFDSTTNHSLQVSSAPQAAAAVLSSTPSADGYEANLRIDNGIFSKVESTDLKSFSCGCFEVRKTGKAIKASSPSKSCTIQITGYYHNVWGALPWLWSILARTAYSTSLNIRFDPQTHTQTQTYSKNETEESLSLVHMASITFGEQFERLNKVEFRLISNEPSRPEGNAVLFVDDLEYVVYPGALMLIPSKDQLNRYAVSRNRVGH